MFNAKQFRNVVVNPSLNLINLWSQEAEDLLVMVMAHESNGGEFLVQKDGPALGIYQMEPATFNSIWSKTLYSGDDKYKIIASKIMLACNFIKAPDASEMVTNLRFATMMARIFFLRNREPIPTDLDMMSVYAKKYWNTEHGKASAQNYLAAYCRFEKIGVA